MGGNDRPAKRLQRSRRNRIVAGVCGGIAEYFGWSPSTVRLAFIASLILPGTQVIIYLVLWILMPNAPRY